METLISIFREIHDPRDFNAQHDLAAMLFISLAATLCGAKSCVDIADFTAAHEATLAEIVDLLHGPPHDSSAACSACSIPRRWLRSSRASSRHCARGLIFDPATGVVTIDGKRFRRGYERGRACMPPLMISVWDAETQLSLASRHAPGGNEVAATLAALKCLVLKGCIVTADALHCHPPMAAEVRATGAHYALKLKANHAPLFLCAQAAFAAGDANGKLTFFEQTDSGHDRKERRHASVIARPANAPSFPGLSAIGRYETEREADGKVVKAVHYVALSKRLSPQRMLEVTRRYWSVENQCHWRLDTAFYEDDARTRKNYGPQNLAVLRRIALDILSAHPDKRSVGRKMKLAAWSKVILF